ncbi:sensor histidine kinase [Tenacibaculum sp. MAR_2009_124]|uniref:sensor histidine kinase n=1 Tax=Tenacibaculum sp. MAR_2009_124 TaxID=1250059 RepID=UPI0015A108EC|nr:sensor histidine kinase [Tenacibaculum sp. MAR_2009_124]
MKIVLLFFSVILFANLYGQEREKNSYEKKIEKIRTELLEPYDGDRVMLEHRYYSLGYYFNKINQPDSAYKYISKSKDLSLELQDTLKIAKRMFSLARIETRKEFFTKSDSTVIEALRFLGPKKNKYKITVSLYNILGNNANYKGDFREAVVCYNKALDLATDSVRIIGYKSNIANNLIYLKEYNQANIIYENIRHSQYFGSISQVLKSKVLDNHAYSRLLNNDNVKESDFLKGQKIKSEINDFVGLSSNYFYLSEFHQKRGGIDKAQEYAQLMYKLALKYDLTSARVLAIDRILSLEPHSRAKELSLEKSNILDSIQKERNEFATTIYNYKDEFNKRIIAENNLAREKLQKQEEIAKQKEQKLLGWLIAAISLSALILVTILFLSRRRKIAFKNQLEKARTKYEERDRIAQELHDGVLSKLFGIRLGLGFLSIKGEKEDLEKHDHLLKDLQNVEQEIREVSHQLSSSNKTDFVELLSQLFQEKSSIGKFTHELDVSGINWDALEKEYKTNLQRIIQELLQNTLKHAKATKVKLSVKRSKNDVYLKYKDNGVGFNMNNHANGIGLKNIKSRVEKLHGESSIFSKPEKGINVEIKLPLRY